jgi:hypothetical protein
MYDAVNGRVLKCGGTDRFSTKLAHKRATTIDLSATHPPTAWNNSTPGPGYRADYVRHKSGFHLQSSDGYLLGATGTWRLAA